MAGSIPCIPFPNSIMSTPTIDDAIEAQVAAEAAATTRKQRPIESGFYKGVAWALFPKTVKRDDGTEVTVFSTVIEGRYRDKDGNYQSTSSFTENQLVAVEDAAREARHHIREQRRRRKLEQ